MICTKCRFITDDDSTFCPRCGEKMASSAEGSEAVARLFKSFNKSVPVNGIKLGSDVSSAQSRAVNTDSQPVHISFVKMPPINANAYVKDTSKIKHNSESEKRIASGNTLDIIKALTAKLTKSIKDDTDRISNGYNDAAECKLSHAIRKSIRANHDYTEKEITVYKSTLRQLEQQLAEFKGQNTLFVQSLDKLWRKIDELMTSYDSKVNDLLEYSKRGSLGSSESAYGTQFVSEWKRDIDSVISNIRLSEIKMADLLLSCDYDTTLYLKTQKHLNTAKLKLPQKNISTSRLSAKNVICMLLVVVSWIIFYAFFTTATKSARALPQNIAGWMIFSGYFLGIFHVGHYSSGIISLIIGIFGGLFVGWYYMIVDPIRFLLGKQCISQNQ